MRIIIATLGRVHDQKTYHSLPDKYKDKVTFIVQPHEFEEMKSIYGDKVVCLPKEVNRLPITREWIHNEYQNERYLVCDDDCHAWHYKEPVMIDGKEVWGFNNGVSRMFTLDDFDNMFDEVNKLMDSGIVHIGMLNSSMKPTSEPNRYPIRSNERIGGIVFYDGPNVPQDLQWTRVLAGEDIDVNLQLLSRGYENRVLTKYCFCISETSAAGGCEIYRNVQNHNESQRILANLWPGIINLREKIVPSGPWKGQTKLNVTVQWKKALNSKKSEGVLDEFFV
mgnify:CR=1 FL=1